MEHPVRTARKAKGLSQDDLADEVKCGQATISEIEQGRYTPGLDLALRLAEALDLEPADLLPSQPEVAS